MRLTYYLEKYRAYKVSPMEAKNLADRCNKVITFGIVNGRCIAILSKHELADKSIVHIREERKVNSFVFKNGYPQQKVIQTYNGYRLMITENVCGMVDIYKVTE